MYSSKFIKYLYPSFFVWEIPSQENEIYLTFDDGPTKGATEDVLDVLKRFNVKATFFCTGANVLSNSDIFNNLLNNGHSVGNHTFNHLNGWKTPKADYLNSIEDCNKLVNSCLFRPPYGRITYPQAYALKSKYKIIMWSLLAYDFDMSLTPEKCLNRSIKNTSKGCIVVFHDSIKAQKNLSFVLPRYIENMIEKKYVFKTLF